MRSLHKNYIYVDSKTGVITYRYRIENVQTSTVTIYDRNLRYFNLSLAGASPEYDKEYSIRVSIDKGSGFGSYGAPYSVFTPSEPE